MKHDVTIRTDNASGGVNSLLLALEPDDLARFERSARGMTAFHAMLAALFAPSGPATATGAQAASELNDLERAVLDLTARADAQGELANRTADEVAGLHALVVGMADRIAAQSELLSRRAGPIDVIVEAAAPAGEADFRAQVDAAADAIADEAGGPPEPLPVPEPSAGGTGWRHPKADAARARRIEIARLLAGEPLGPKAIRDRLEIPQGSIGGLLAHEWFGRRPGVDTVAYQLTAAGRAALTEAGRVLVPKAETKRPEPETVAPRAEPEAPPADTLDGAARAKAQCKLIAETIVAAGSESMTCDEIARACGLPPDAVRKRLLKRGPSSVHAIRYFCKSEKYADCWRVTSGGAALAQEGATT